LGYYCSSQLLAEENECHLDKYRAGQTDPICSCMMVDGNMMESNKMHTHYMHMNTTDFGPLHF